jgi:AcrR family transcriptional regulator
MTSPELTALIEERRPKRADARRNFDALVEAGRDAFAADGAGASLEDVARRAGVGIGTLYRNFATRDSLIEAVYLEEVAGVAAYAEALEAGEPFEALSAWLRRFAEYAATKKVLLAGFNGDSPLLQSCRTVVYESGEPLLEHAQAAGAVRKDVEIGDVVRLVSGVAGVTFTDAAQRDRVIDVALDGLRAR